MRNKQRVGLLGVFCAAAVMLSFVSAWADGVFLRYNVHTQFKVSRGGEQVYNASYANYTDPGAGHVVIPAGSEILVLKTARKEFTFKVLADGKVVDFEFHEPRMGMNAEQYVSKITSSEPISLAAYSDKDRAGIAEGKALIGMSKEGVVAALGYPAAHRTPSLDSPSWVYWTNRFKTVVVEFDEQGKVKSIRD